MSLTQKVVVNTTTLAVGRVVSALSGVLCVAIATRYLGLNAFGALMTALALVTIVAALSDLGVSAIGAREIAKNPDQTGRLLGGIFTAALLLASMAALVGVAVAFIAYSGPGEEMRRNGLLLLVAPAPIGAISATYGSYFISQQRAYLTTFSSLGASAVQLTVIILAVTLDLGYVGIAAAYASQAVASSVISSAIGMRQVRIRPWIDFSLGKQLLAWAIPLGVNNFIYSLYARFDILMLSLLASERAVALYGLAFKLIDFVTILPNYAMITLFPEFAKLHDQPERFNRVFSRALSVMQATAAALVGFFLVFADEAVEVVGGPRFDGAANLLRVLVVGAGLTYISSVFGQALVARNRQKRLLIVSLVGFPINALLNVALIPVLGAMGASIAFSAEELFSLALLVYLYRSEAPIPVPQRVPQVLLAVLVAACVGFLKLAPFHGAASAWIELAVGGVTFLAVYAGSLYAFHAMPPVIHQNLVLPAWARLQRAVRTATVRA